MASVHMTLCVLLPSNDMLFKFVHLGLSPLVGMYAPVKNVLPTMTGCLCRLALTLPRRSLVNSLQSLDVTMANRPMLRKLVPSSRP